jgi:hypothetical protein
VTPNDRRRDRFIVSSACAVTLSTPLASSAGTIRDVSLTGVSVALDRIEPKITVGTSAVVTVGDVYIAATVRHAEQDRPWDPIYGLQFDASAADVANFLTAVVGAR